MSVGSGFRAALVIVIAVAATAWCIPAGAVSKVFLTNGETRLGDVLVREGRVTIKGEDRLFQHPERAVHRIEHVTGSTTLVGSDDILLRETPEPLSKNLVAVPKGCEVKLLERVGDYAKVEVFGGEDLATGYIHVEDLSDNVFFNPVPDTLRFRLPPPPLSQRFGARPQDKIENRQNETETKPVRPQMIIPDLPGLKPATPPEPTPQVESATQP